MKQSFIISAIGHAILVVLMITGLPLFNKPPTPTDDVVPVELVDRIEEVAKAPPRPQPEPPKPADKPVEPPKEEPQPITVPEPPKPLADAVPDLEPKPQKKPEPEKPKEPEQPKTPKASPQQKPKAPSRFDPNRIAALLDKKIEEQPKERTTPLDVSKLLDKPNRSQLETEQLAASLRSMIRAQVEPCWSVPAGARYAEELKVVLRIFLLPNGALAKVPEIVDSRRMSDDFYRVAAESARRAVQRCAPLKLPADTYDIWRETELVFDPSDMLGG